MYISLAKVKGCLRTSRCWQFWIRTTAKGVWWTSAQIKKSAGKAVRVQVKNKKGRTIENCVWKAQGWIWETKGIDEKRRWWIQKIDIIATRITKGIETKWTNIEIRWSNGTDEERKSWGKNQNNDRKGKRILKNYKKTDLSIPFSIQVYKKRWNNRDWRQTWTGTKTKRTSLENGFRQNI